MRAMMGSKFTSACTRVLFLDPLPMNGIVAPCIMRNSSKEGPKVVECPESLNVSTHSSRLSRQQLGLDSPEHY